MIKQRLFDFQRLQDAHDELAKQLEQAKAGKQAATDKLAQLETQITDIQAELKAAKKSLKDAL